MLGNFSDEPKDQRKPKDQYQIDEFLGIAGRLSLKQVSTEELKFIYLLTNAYCLVIQIETKNNVQEGLLQ